MFRSTGGHSVDAPALRLLGEQSIDLLDAMNRALDEPTGKGAGVRAALRELTDVLEDVSEWLPRDVPLIEHLERELSSLFVCVPNGYILRRQAPIELGRLDGRERGVVALVVPPLPVARSSA